MGWFNSGLWPAHSKSLISSFLGGRGGASVETLYFAKLCCSVFQVWLSLSLQNGQNDGWTSSLRMLCKEAEFIFPVFTASHPGPETETNTTFKGWIWNMSTIATSTLSRIYLQQKHHSSCLVACFAADMPSDEPDLCPVRNIF